MQSYWLVKIPTAVPRKPGSCDQTVPLLGGCITVWCVRLMKHLIMAKCCIALSGALLDDNGSLNSILKMWFKARFAKRAYLLCAPAFTKTAGCWTISEEATSCQEHATYVRIRLPLCIYVRSLVSFNQWTLKWWNQTLERIWHIKVNWPVHLYKSTGPYWLVITTYLSWLLARFALCLRKASPMDLHSWCWLQGMDTQTWMRNS